jgi:hypothetical protein
MADSVRVYFEPYTGDFMLEDELDLDFDLLVYLYNGKGGTKFKIVKFYATNTLALLARPGDKYTLCLYQCMEWGAYYLYDSSCYQGDLGDVTRLESDQVSQAGGDYQVTL